MQGLKTTAVRSGSRYIVNGAKKWITNGIFADYCTAAVRTGGPGRGGLSLLIIRLDAKGVTRRKMENSGVNASGSTYIEFDDVEVPIENLIGQENHGFLYIMSSESSSAARFDCYTDRTQTSIQSVFLSHVRLFVCRGYALKTHTNMLLDEKRSAQP